MSINCLLTNDVIIEKLSALITNPPPVNTIVNLPLLPNEWFTPNHIILTKSTIENVSTNYIFTAISGDTKGLMALKNIVPDDVISLDFLLPVDFAINNALVVPCLIINNLNISNTPPCILVIYNNYVAPNTSCQINIKGLSLDKDNIIDLFNSPFTLFKGQ